MKPSPEIEKPLACPFCGASAMAIRGGVEPLATRIHCAAKACAAHGPRSASGEVAVALWNRLAKRSTRGKGK